MAEVRSKMSDVKSQVLEARGSGEPRPGPSGAFGMEEMSHRGDSEMSACRKPSELDLVGRTAAARSRPCRPGEEYVMECAQLLSPNEMDFKWSHK